MLQVLGRDLDNAAERVLYWKPPDTREGTRITLYVAQYADVPTEDLGDAAVAAGWQALVGGG